MLIVFEGADGVGKTTLSEMLRHSESLDNPYLFTFPGKEPGTLGAEVYRLHHEFCEMSETSRQLLHVAAHVQVLEKSIVPLLKDGRTVIMDRYWWSMVAYSKAAGLDAELLRRMLGIEMPAWENIKPGVVFLINRTPNDSTEAVCGEYERLAMHERVNYPVFRIHNEGRTIEDTLEEVITRIRKVKG